MLRLFGRLHTAGQTLVNVAHDSRIAATADHMISVRDGAFIDETRLTGGGTASVPSNSPPAHRRAGCLAIDPNRLTRMPYPVAADR